MLNRIGIIIAAAAALGVIMGCSPRQAPQPALPTDTAVERVGDLQLYQLVNGAFANLSLQQKRYAWHLYRAGVEGRRIAYHQRIPYGLELLDLLEILVPQATDTSAAFDNALRAYAIRFWAFTGNYDVETSRKFVPAFTPDELNSFIERKGLNALLEAAGIDLVALQPYIFDATFEPVLVSKSPDSGVDVLAASAVNLYDPGITRRDIEKLQRRYGLNARFSSGGDGTVVEEVYRSGGPDITPGRLAETMQNVISELETALQYAPDESRPALLELIRCFRTGEPEAFDKHCELWVKDSSSPVDYIMGFVEVYDDPLASLGTFEAMVFVEDSALSAEMRRLAENAAWFEQRMPWDDRFKKQEFTLPSARAYQVLGGFGDGGPQCPVGINLPNSQKLRETVGTKNFLLSNVMQTGALDRSRKYMEEFLPTPEERETALTAFEARRVAMVAMHEVIGHGSGKVLPDLKGDPDDYLKEYSSTLEEARADLVALWFIGDSHLTELGITPPDLGWKPALTSTLVWALIAHHDVPQGDRFEEDHTRAGQLISNYIMKEGGGIREKVNGKTYYRLTDVEKARAAVGKLLTEIMRIKATGDYGAAKQLVETYGVRLDPGLRDEVVRRADALDIPRHRAFIMPEPTLVKNRMGGVVDVELSHPRDFVGQMLRFGGK